MDDTGDLFGVLAARFCRRCGRALTNPISVKTGYGPECRSALGITTPTAMSQYQDRQHHQPLHSTAIATRAADGAIETNVPHLCCHHSPTGFEIGYPGSGPADLALNLAESVARRLGYNEIGSPVACNVEGYACRIAFDAHQEVKALVAALPPEGGEIPLVEVQRILKRYADAHTA